MWSLNKNIFNSLKTVGNYYEIVIKINHMLVLHNIYKAKYLMLYILNDFF